jgi:hypothetical protein
MSAKLFQGLNCENGTPKAQASKQAVENMKALGKTLGLSKQCERASDTMTRNSSSSGGFSGSMSVMGGLAGSAKVSGNFQASSAELDASFREKGCGSLLLDSKDILDATRRINCTLNQSSSETSQQLSNRVSVQVRILPIPGVKEKMIAQVGELAKQLVMAKEYTEIATMINGQITALNKSISDIGTLNITNSTIKAKAGSKLKTMSQNVTSVASKMEADYKRIVEASANNTLQQKAGANAMQPGVRQLVQQRIETQSDEINSDIIQTLSHTSVKVTQSGSIIITAPNRITLTNTVIDANSEIDMVTSALTSSSVDLGKRIASELMSSAASKNEMTMDSEGLDQLVDAMNEGNASAIKAQSDGLIGQIKANAMPFSIGLIALIFIPLFMGGTKSMSGKPMPGGMTAVQQKTWKTKQTQKKMIKIILGLLVKLIVIFNIVRLGPKILNIFLPWKWKELRGVVEQIILNLIILMAYCVFINKSVNPVMCLIKF